ncbi:MAG TPA: hypothetical protein VFY43_03560 [Candidatus Limnocylindria bacterium]|nr:hypothetical protein [Candidatus Limnocylindria bacterium]
MPDTAIADFLRAEGFVSPVSAAAAREVLEDAGLTRPGKARMADEKLDRARDALILAVVRHCSDPACLAAAGADGRRLIETDKPHCAICSGSNNTRALRRMASACATAGVRRVLVVGGRPPMWSEMDRTLAGSGLDLRYVDGTSKLPSGADALRDCAWAELLVVWAPTPLPHKVSDLYRADVCVVARRVVVHRRGIEALAMEVVSHLER